MSTALFLDLAEFRTLGHSQVRRTTFLGYVLVCTLQAHSKTMLASGLGCVLRKTVVHHIVKWRFALDLADPACIARLLLLRLLIALTVRVPCLIRNVRRLDCRHPATRPDGFRLVP